MAAKGADARNAELRQKAFELRKAGASFRAIANAIGVHHRSAQRYVEQAIAELVKTTTLDVEGYRRMQLEQINDLMLALWPNKTDPQTSRAIAALLARQAKLLGLDAADVTNDKIAGAVTFYLGVPDLGI